MLQSIQSLQDSYKQLKEDDEETIPTEETTEKSLEVTLVADEEQEEKEQEIQIVTMVEQPIKWRKTKNKLREVIMEESVIILQAYVRALLARRKVNKMRKKNVLVEHDKKPNFTMSKIQNIHQLETPIKLKPKRQSRRRRNFSKKKSFVPIRLETIKEGRNEDLSIFTENNIKKRGKKQMSKMVKKLKVLKTYKPKKYRYYEV